MCIRDRIYDEINKIKESQKIVYASFGSIAASGGYYIACAADYILANPGTLTGSIGAIMAFNNVEELLQQVEYFVDALSDYSCDVALFHEFFNAP